MANRYKGIKGKFWKIFSEYIRRRDFAKYGTCISCNRMVEDWRNADAGHFIPAGGGGFALLFDEMNVHLQHKPCNNPNFNPHDKGYAIYLDKRYGLGTAESLQNRYEDAHFRGKTTKEWTKREYEDKIKEYEDKLKALNEVPNLL